MLYCLEKLLFFMIIFLNYWAEYLKYTCVLYDTMLLRFLKVLIFSAERRILWKPHFDTITIMHNVW